MSGIVGKAVRRMRSGIPTPHLQAKGAENVHGEDMWLDNDDIRPLKLADRTWNLWTYLTFWFSATATVSNWYAASSAQALGLSMWESIACNFGGQCLIAIVIVLNGRAGAKYHIGYPILNRASFGIFGAWWPTFNRAVMAIVWNGMKPLVYAKLIVFVISAIAMCAWTLTLAGGIGAVARQPGTAHGSTKAWLVIRFFLLGAANCATFASNAADFQRYATKPNDVILGNLLGFPLANLIVSIVGNLVGSSSQIVFGEIVWNPLTYLDMLQTTNYTAANRAGCFFIAGCFTYSAIFSSIFENSLPAGNDIAALFPKYLTVRKGFFICAVVSFAINPWYLLGSASIFISFLASYQIFLSAITGVLLSHYYIISRGYLEIDDLYTSRKSGVYHYIGGWNWRAYAAYIIGIIPNFYGFLNNMGVSAPLGVTQAYYFAYPIGLFLSFFVYWAANYISPPPLRFPLSEWHEPKDYIRPEERGEIVAGVALDVESDPGDGYSDKKAVEINEKAISLEN
ncbi:hypothetical protein B7463_g4134, partial [Scytalidium lignicola]